MSEIEILENLSVVVQGPIREMSKESLLSVRRFLPNCKIILSTWEGSDLEGLEYDELVLSPDPHQEEGVKYPTNANRMIVSTKAGLDLVKTKYVLKTRTDLMLTGTNFINLFLLNSPPPKEYQVFEKRVVCYAWKPLPGRLFHCGDFYFFGLTSDVQKLWDLPLYTSKHYFYLNEHEAVNPRYRIKNTNQFHVEQYIWINLLNNNGIKCELKDYTDWSPEFKLLTERTFIENLIFASFTDFSMFASKPNLIRYNYPIQPQAYIFRDWVRLCRQYFDADFQPNYSPKFPNCLVRMVAFTFVKIPVRLISCLAFRRKMRQDIRLIGEKVMFKWFASF